MNPHTIVSIPGVMAVDEAKIPCHSPSVSDAATNRAPCRRYVSIEPVIKSDASSSCEQRAFSSCEQSASSAWGGARIGAGRKRRQQPAPHDPGPLWFCVRTLAGLQLTADIEIRRFGFEVFNPSLFKPATPARRTPSGVVVPARPDRIEGLFRGYLFTRFHRALDTWRPLYRLPGVDRIIGSSPDRPVAVPQDAVDAIRATLAPNGCLYPPEHRPGPIATGVQVRLSGGVMAGLDGLCEWSDGRRVRLLLDILGRRVRVTVAQDSVEAF